MNRLVYYTLGDGGERVAEIVGALLLGAAALCAALAALGLIE
jgi:hypothetical protein